MELENAKALMDGTPDAAKDPTQVQLAQLVAATKKTTVVDQAVLLAKERSELWQDSDGKAFASFKTGGLLVNAHLESSEFNTWLSSEVYGLTSLTMNDQQIKTASRILSHEAKKGPTHIPCVRIGELNGDTYMDLASGDGNVVKITKDGWTVITSSPVKFLRSKGMEALPVPATTASVAPFWALIDMLNLPDESARILTAGWLLSSLRPKGPYIILQIVGEQGSSKTTTCMALKSAIDPARAGRRSLSKSEQDLFVAAHNNRLLLFDNVSHLSQELSDAFCRLSTGGGYGTRKLYADDCETLFDTTRPILFNGIEEFITRQDLIDRTIAINVKTIPDDRRLTEREFWERFHGLLPEALGALLNLYACAMRRVDSVKLTSKPRMADPTVFVTAASEMFGWGPDTFLNAYLENRQQAVISGLETSPLAQILIGHIGEVGFFEGSPTELFNLVRLYAERQRISFRDLPQGPSRMSGALTRLAPAFRAAGIAFERLPRGNNRRIRISKNTSAMVAEKTPTALLAAPSSSATATTETSVATDGTVGSKAQVDILGNPIQVNPDCAECLSFGTECPDCFLS